MYAEDCNDQSKVLKSLELELQTTYTTRTYTIINTNIHAMWLLETEVRYSTSAVMALNL